MMMMIRSSLSLTSLMTVSLLLLCLLLSLTVTNAMPNNGLGRVPPMGWNAWYAYFRDINEDAMKEAADQLVQLGLRDLGYQYVNLDDDWMAAERDAVTQQYVANATKFPNGMPALAQYIHDRGLKMGIYTSAGTMTCVSLPGSLYHEDVDAQTFADWGIDFVKYDDCYGDGTPDVVRYSRMRNALLATGRPIFFSLCNGGENDIWRWAPSMGNSWRSTTDIQRTWKTIVPNFWNNQQHLESMPFGKFTYSWPDPDMLQIGEDQAKQVITLAEQRSQFGLWVLAKAPLILSTNLTTLVKESLDIITNQRLIAIHQSPDYPPARCYVGCRIGDKNTLAQGNWSSYSVLATSNVYEDREDEHTTAPAPTKTIAVVINWHDNETLTNYTLLSHDIGIVPMPNTQLVVTNLWTGQVVKTMRIVGGTSTTTKKKGGKGGCRKLGRSSVRGTTATTTTMTTTTPSYHQAYEPISIDIPPLGPHDNVILQFETTTAAAAAAVKVGDYEDDEEDCDDESSSSLSSVTNVVATA